MGFLTQFVSHDEIIESASDIIDKIEYILMTVIKLNEKEKIIEDGAKIGFKVLKTIKTIKLIN